jgi:hypothetical protein
VIQEFRAHWPAIVGKFLPNRDHRFQANLDRVADASDGLGARAYLLKSLLDKELLGTIGAVHAEPH